MDLQRDDSQEKEKIVFEDDLNSSNSQESMVITGNDAVEKCSTERATLPSSSSKRMKEFSISATQTLLTFETVGKIDLPATMSNILFDSRLTRDTTKSLVNPTSFPPVSNSDEIPVKSSHEAATQATPTHSTLASTASVASAASTAPVIPRDTLQISTSLSSSGLKSEILTVTTDYASSSPDACSILIDAIDQNGNRGLRLSVQEAFAVPSTRDCRNYRYSTQEDSSARRTNPRRWSLQNCLRCSIAENDQPDSPWTRDAPPTYSAIYADRPSAPGNLRSFPDRFSFVAPVPPPSYAQAQGVCLATYSMDRFVSISSTPGEFLSSRPTAAFCPRCVTIVVTAIEARRSIVTHVTALMLFLCGCWPCCMVPYCTNSCKSIDHYCPICRAHLGTYRPW